MAFSRNLTERGTQFEEDDLQSEAVFESSEEETGPKNQSFLESLQGETTRRRRDVKATQMAERSPSVNRRRRNQASGVGPHNTRARLSRLKTKRNMQPATFNPCTEQKAKPGGSGVWEFLRRAKELRRHKEFRKKGLCHVDDQQQSSDTDEKELIVKPDTIAKNTEVDSPTLPHSGLAGVASSTASSEPYECFAEGPPPYLPSPPLPLPPRQRTWRTTEYAVDAELGGIPKPAFSINTGPIRVFHNYSAIHGTDSEKDDARSTKTSSASLLSASCASHESSDINWGSLESLESHRSTGEYEHLGRSDREKMDSLFSHKNKPPPTFCKTWQNSHVFTSKGGLLRQPESDVVLSVPFGAVSAFEVVEIYSAICADVGHIRETMKLEDNEEVVSPLVEYSDSQEDFKFLRPVSIILPHCLPSNFNPDCVNVYHITSQNNGLLTKRVRQQDLTTPDTGQAMIGHNPSSSKLKTGPERHDSSEWVEHTYFTVGENGKITIFVESFCAFVCTYCHDKQKRVPEMYVIACGSYTTMQGFCSEMKVSMHAWDRRIKVADFRKYYGVIGEILAEEPLLLLHHVMKTSLHVRLRMFADTAKMVRHCKDEMDKHIMAIEQRFDIPHMLHCKNCLKKQRLTPVSKTWLLEPKPDVPLLARLRFAVDISHTSSCLPDWKNTKAGNKEEKVTTLSLTLLVGETTTPCRGGSVESSPLSPGNQGDPSGSCYSETDEETRAKSIIPCEGDHVLEEGPVSSNNSQPALFIPLSLREMLEQSVDPSPMRLPQAAHEASRELNTPHSRETPFEATAEYLRPIQFGRSPPLSLPQPEADSSLQARNRMLERELQLARAQLDEARRERLVENARSREQSRETTSETRYASPNQQRMLSARRRLISQVSPLDLLSQLNVDLRLSDSDTDILSQFSAIANPSSLTSRGAAGCQLRASPSTSEDSMFDDSYFSSDSDHRGRIPPHFQLENLK